jgi:hypothetical protein
MYDAQERNGMSLTVLGATNAIQLLGLALMIGGMLALGAFTAPVLFKQFARPEAGEAMTMIFRRYDIVLAVSVGMVLIGEVVRIALTGLPVMTLFNGFRYGVLILLSVLMLYSVYGLNAKMEALQKVPNPTPEQKQAFVKSHQQSEQFYKVEMLLAVVLMTLMAFSIQKPNG